MSRTDRRTGRHAGQEVDLDAVRHRATLEERLAATMAEGDREQVSRLRDALAELED